MNWSGCWHLNVTMVDGLELIRYYTYIAAHIGAYTMYTNFAQDYALHVARARVQGFCALSKQQYVKLMARTALV